MHSMDFAYRAFFALFYIPLNISFLTHVDMARVDLVLSVSNAQRLRFTRVLSICVDCIDSLHVFKTAKGNSHENKSYRCCSR